MPRWQQERTFQEAQDQISKACLLPVAHPTPAGHPRSIPEFLREHLPGDAAVKARNAIATTFDDIAESTSRGYPRQSRVFLTSCRGRFPSTVTQSPARMNISASLSC